MGLNFHIYKSRLDETFLFLAVIVNNLQLSWRVREMGSENVKIMSLFKSQMSRKYYLKEDIDGTSGFVFPNYFSKYAI